MYNKSHSGLNYDKCDALQLVNHVNRHDVSPSELLDFAWKRSCEVNHLLNAIAWPNIESAREAAESPVEGPFKGVPFAVKDFIATVRGFRMTGGSRLLRDNIAAEDSELVRRIRSLGFNIFGMTTTPEMALNPVSEAKVYAGPTANPWNLEYSSGGSSGGAAAAVAAGILPIAHASDGGGSIRIPASACGVFGLKPTRGRNPLGPRLGEGLGGLAVEHAVSRSVRDSAALLDFTQGMDPGAPYSAPPVEGNYLVATQRDPAAMRIGVVTVGPNGFPIHPDCLSAMEGTAALCEELGHVVEPIDLAEVNFARLHESSLVVQSVGAAGFVEAGSARLGRMPTEDEIEPLILDAARYSSELSPLDYSAAIAAFHAAGRVMARLMQGLDMVLTPSLLTPPVKLGSFDTDTPFIELRERVARHVGFLPLANFTGLPAMSVPLTWNDAGLPIGSHFIGRWGGELSMFALAAQLERARPWFHRRPKLQ